MRKVIITLAAIAFGALAPAALADHRGHEHGHGHAFHEHGGHFEGHAFRHGHGHWRPFLINPGLPGCWWSPYYDRWLCE